MNHILLSEIKNEIKIAVRLHYSSLKEKYPEESFYGYSLYTSDDVTSIGPVANRESAIEISENDHMYNYYRYSPDEWSDWDDFGIFQQVNHLISEYHSEVSEDFETVRQGLLKNALFALNELDVEGLFGKKDDSRFIIVWVSDSGDEIMGISARELNKDKVYNEFASEFLNN